MSFWKGKKVLEIGCGIGTDGVEFIRNGAKYFGTELSSNSLNIFKERIKVLKLSHKNLKLRLDYLTLQFHIFQVH